MKQISPSLSVSFHAWKNPHNAYAGFLKKKKEKEKEV
jgi:hypothetical protein